MLRNTFIASIRSLMKTRGTSILNILALTIAIGACMVAYFHIRYELSFDQFHSNSDRIYRVVTGDPNTDEHWVKVSTPIPPKMKAELPEVESFARLTEFSYNEKVSVAYDLKVFNEPSVYLADTEIFNMFDFEIQRGSPKLTKTGVAISREVADKYFDKEDPIGKRLNIDGRMDFEVVAIYSNMPDNSHFDPDFIVSFENLEEVKPGTSLTGNWGQFNYFSYVMLQPGSDHKVVTTKLQNLVAEYGDNQTMKFERLNIQPLTDIHFQNNRGNIKASYDTKYLYIYGAIALAILIISFVNFMNLSVATSTRRIKEVGVRKVLGATKSQLTTQFVAESIVMSGIATFLAIGVTYYVLPIVNEFIGSASKFTLADEWLLMGLLTLIAIIAMFSGIYIALYILSFNPIAAVKGLFKIGNKGRNFKASLLTIQFAVSCILILSSVFVYSQLNYIKGKDIGMQDDGVVTLKLFDESAQDKVELLIDELEKVSGVKNVSASRFTPGSTNWHQTVRWPDQDREISWNMISVDENFLETYGIELIEGSAQDVKNASGHQRVTYIINEAAVKEAGWETGFGKSISAFGKNGYYAVSAVAKNFNYKSLHNPVEPCILYISENAKYSQVSIQFGGQNIASVMASIKEEFFKVMPNTPLEYEFADDQFAQLYEVEQQTGRLVSILTVIAVGLAMMGVYALLTFTIKERTREIAIRKVLGIKFNQTAALLSGDYLKLMILGNVIGLPVTWYMIDLWLQNFSYQINMSWTYLLIPPVLTLLLILAVIGLKTQQVENINPVESLRYE